ncbi:MAG: hypothetical protein SGCHY_000755 [Lobulomycetales sp.]
MVHLKTLFDVHSYALRVAMMEVLGNLVAHILRRGAGEGGWGQAKPFYDILMERLRDRNSFVRAKVLWVLARLTSERTFLSPEHRVEYFSLVATRLLDSSAKVRANAVKCLAVWVETAPYVVFKRDNGKIDGKLFQARLHEIEETIKARETVVDDGAQADDADDEDLKKLRALSRYYSDGLALCNAVERASGSVLRLLSSTKKTDVVEAINFFATCSMFGMSCAELGMRQMVHRVWDREVASIKEVVVGSSKKGVADDGGVVLSAESVVVGTSIREHLAQTYRDAYLKQYPPAETEKEDAIAAANNLIRLTSFMTLSEITSLEALVGLMVEKDMITPAMIDSLWYVFGKQQTLSVPAPEASKKRCGALMVLSMMARTRKEIIVEKLQVLLTVGLGELARDDFILARQACIALQRLAATSASKQGAMQVEGRMAITHPLFDRLKELLIDISSESQTWFGFAEQSINTIYLLAEQPDILCGQVIKKLTEKVFGLSNPNDGDISAIVANLNAVNIDSSAASNEATNGEDDSAKANVAGMTCSSFQLSKLIFVVGHVAVKQIEYLELIESEWKRRRHAESSNKKGGDDLELVSGSAEDEFSEAVAVVREQEILFGNRSLLSVFGPLVSFICSNNLTFSSNLLQVISVLTLSKLMCISSAFCDRNLQLLFTILSKSDNPVIRSNIVIGLGDMAVCFNSLIDQNISYVYGRLHDSDFNVRKNTLMVLTHLILNGMIKVKGQISEMAKCLEDSDPRISDLARLFFTELSTKDNAVYNNLPDIISNLSSIESGLEENSFKKVMEFLFSFIKKAHHLDNLVEKLCLRFKGAGGARQWRDIAFCLSLIPFTSANSFKKLVEGLPCYQDKLHEPDVYKSIGDIIASMKKQKSEKHQKVEKSVLEEFEAKVIEFHDECVGEEETVAKASGRKRKERRQSTRRKNVVRDSSSEEDVEIEERESGEDVEMDEQGKEESDVANEKLEEESDGADEMLKDESDGADELA